MTKAATKTNRRENTPLKIALVVPHIFINDGIFEDVIFSPGDIAIDLYKNLPNQEIDVTLFSPGKVSAVPKNITADMSYFEAELKGRGYGYIELLKKHPMIFVSLSRQVQAEIISKAFRLANEDKFDLVHIYTNEEDIGLQFANLCKKPVVFTHHDPFRLLIRYKSVFPRYKHLNHVSISLSQRNEMPEDTNWVANIYHGLDENKFTPNLKTGSDYLAYIGRIIEPKGVHLAIEAIKLYNKNHKAKLKLKIAGKHYAGLKQDSYWKTRIEPELSEFVEYVGYIKGAEREEFLKDALGLLVPSTFNEPFGMVTIESLACGTPVIGLGIGATKEIIKHRKTGFIAKGTSDYDYIKEISNYIDKLSYINREDCRKSFEDSFTTTRMAKEHSELYRSLCKESTGFF